MRSLSLSLWLGALLTSGCVEAVSPDDGEDASVTLIVEPDARVTPPGPSWTTPPDASSFPIHCFSPQNSNGALGASAVGCPCSEAREVCLGGFGLSCSGPGDTWSVFYDGPCAPRIDGGVALVCYSPTQNANLALQPGSVGCPCGPTDKDVCVNGVGLICSQGKWQGVLDGPCFPQPTALTPEACKAKGAVALADPGDGSLLRAGCPGGTPLLGNIIGYDEGGLCCATKACGARAGNTCSSTEYCAYQAGEYCGAADAESFCRPRPTACDANYDPVCGCNQKTYSNDCQAALAGTGVLNRGVCK